MIKIKLFITGGHVTPAVAVIEEIKRRKLPWELVFVGRKFAFEKSRVVSEEYRLITNLGIRWLSLTTGRLSRDLNINALLSLLKLPIGFAQAFWFILSEKPTAILSFGGYVALPIAIVGWLLGVPVITHEQTLAPGLANRIISVFASVVCVSFPGQAKVLRGKKIVYTGLPLRQGLFQTSKNSGLNLPQDKPILLILGGSAGAKTLNELIYPIIPLLCERFVVVHQVGRESQDIVKNMKDKRYFPMVYLAVDDYARSLKKAKLVLGRSGANTVMEIAALGKVAIFVPLPWAAADEQWENAQFLVRENAAIAYRQSDLTPDRLVEVIDKTLKHYQSLEKNAVRVSKLVERDGAAKVVDQVSFLCLRLVE